MKMFFSCEKVQVMTVRQLHAKKKIVSNSKSSLIGDLTNFLHFVQRLTRYAVSAGQLRKSPPASASITTTYVS